MILLKEANQRTKFVWRHSKGMEMSVSTKTKQVYTDLVETCICTITWEAVPVPVTQYNCVKTAEMQKDGMDQV